MKYKGIELEEITEPQVFLHPKKMLAWNEKYLAIRTIVAILPGGVAIDEDKNWISHCAEIPDDPKPRRATNRELAKWLALGNGELSIHNTEIHSYFNYTPEDANSECKDEIFKVRKWDDSEWHEPTIDYMGIEA